jgi:hypothetical protein
MSNRGAQQQISIERLPSLLREVYEGRLLLPVSEPGTWDDERRLKLFESIYRGLPIGSLTVWRTTTHLEHYHVIGSVPLQERPVGVSGERLRMYLVDGAVRIATLFEELGTSFWYGDKSGLRRQPVPGQGSFIVFDLETRTFRVRQQGKTPRVTEMPLAGLFDAETQHVFSAQFRALPDGERLANRLAHLVDAFFDFSLPVITVVSDDVESLRLFLLSLGKPEPTYLSPSPQTTWWLCDTCGQKIEHPGDGVMEYLLKPDEESGMLLARGLKLVHTRQASPLRSGCGYDETKESERDGSSVAAEALPSRLGTDGSTTLLLDVSIEMFPLEQLVELGRRLLTPGYERARFHLAAAIQQGIFKPKLPVSGFYLQEEIAATLEWADRTGRKP